MANIRLFLVDDHMVVRAGLKMLISAHPDMTIVGEAEDGEAACEEIADCQPDVVIMDISMPRMNGIQATERLKQRCPNVKVLLLSVHDDTSYLRQMLAVGAAGYILKHTVADALIQAIRTVAAGGLYLEPGLAEHVVSRYVRRPTAATELLGAELSDRARGGAAGGPGLQQQGYRHPAEPERKDGGDVPRPRAREARPHQPISPGALCPGARLAPADLRAGSPGRLCEHEGLHSEVTDS